MSRPTRMEQRRLKLQAELEEILGSDRVYFQPPSSIHLSYPCIVYSYDDINIEFADGVEYLERDKYTITVISKDPLPDEILTAIDSMDYTFFDRHYTNDNLHHFSYTRHLLERA